MVTLSETVWDNGLMERRNILQRHFLVAGWQQSCLQWKIYWHIVKQATGLISLPLILH
jgi:hypothetical protein